MNRRLQAALRYAGRGWPVFPLDGKVPLKGSHGHHDATTNKHLIRKWWRHHPRSNIGIALGKTSGLLIVDTDSRKGEAALKTLLGGKRPRTLTVRTGRGHHRYFKYPEGVTIRRKVRLRPDLDLLGSGYVVGAESVHPKTGRRYSVVIDGPIAPTPPALLAALQNTKANKPPGLANVVTPGAAVGPHRIRAYIDKLPVGMHDGDGRNATAYRLAAWLTHDAGLTHDNAMRWLAEWNGRQAEPYPDEKLA